MATSQVFADDEPMFASPQPFSSDGAGAAAGHSVAEPETGPAAENDHWDRAELRAASQTSPLRHDSPEEHYEEMQVIGDIGADEVDAQEDDFEEVAEAPTQDLKRSQNSSSEPAFASPGTIEEEEIEEEEADLASYVEEIEQDAHFEELEEETQAADGNGHLPVHRSRRRHVRTVGHESTFYSREDRQPATNSTSLAAEWNRRCALRSCGVTGHRRERHTDLEYFCRIAPTGSHDRSLNWI